MVSQLEIASPTNASVSYLVKGAVHLYINPHRSFFSTVIAQAMRVAGQGTSVLVVQLLKGGINQGADNGILLGSHLKWVRCGIERCIDTPHLEPEEQVALDELWQFTKDAIQSGEYGLVVLDELGLALKLGLIAEDDALSVLQNRPPSMDVSITGPEMPESLLEMSEQITHLKSIA
ncbi:MAG: cob(I)yrinic acid a,c-diamide adenosyltransferase [Synechococcus sp.]